jgi:uncharacterized protein YegP (UPF0339 family)
MIEFQIHRSQNAHQPYFLRIVADNGKILASSETYVNKADVTRHHTSGQEPGTDDNELASIAETLAGLTAAARGGSLYDRAALSALATARNLAAATWRPTSITGSWP